MARLIVKYEGLPHRLANVVVAKRDGSITLALSRPGFNILCWQRDLACAEFNVSDYVELMSKTERITIHTSGRINFHGSPNPIVNFIPCLLDLTGSVPIFAYVIPAAATLDFIEKINFDDHVVELEGASEKSFGFEFSAVPVSFPSLPGEIWRFIIEGCYGLACALVDGDLYPSRKCVPLEVFSVFRPSSMLPQQSIPEDQAFIRFQQLMHANQVRQVLASSVIPEQQHDQITLNVVRQGRGIQGPNKEGVWEIICNVPMRVRPVLVVEFPDPRYRAEMVDMTLLDKRLEKVRVRFKIYDQQATRWVKQPVEISRVLLDAEL